MAVESGHVEVISSERRGLRTESHDVSSFSHCGPQRNLKPRARCNAVNDPHNCSGAEFVSARRIDGNAT